MGSPDSAPDRVGPSQPPLNFVDGNGYIVLRGLVEARDCEVGRNLGYAMPSDVLHCWLSVSRNDNHWTGCVITHEHHPELAL